MEITYLGHYSFLIKLNQTTLLIDPFIKANPLNQKIDIDAIECDYILLTHGHQDHCSDVLAIQKRTSAQLISNFEICSWFENQGVKNFRPMNTGGTFHTEHFSIKVVAAVHSSTLPDGTTGGTANGFILYTPSVNLYISGDTALTYDMKLIKEYWGPIHCAILPIGDNFTMGIEDAVIAADFSGTNQVIGAHYDTFGYIVIDHQKAQKIFTENNKKLHLLPIGEFIKL